MPTTQQRPVRVLLRLALYPLSFFVLLRWFEHRQVYHPSPGVRAEPGELNIPWEKVDLTTADGVKLRAWFFPATAPSRHSTQVVLHCHGNAGNMGHRLDVADALLETGINVLLFDYRGYGQSAGRPSEEGTYRDAEAAYDWLRERGFAAANILAFGESLGGGVACELARRRPVGGLILQSTFTSIPDMGAKLFPYLPVRWLAHIQYDTHAKLPQLHVPVLILHSRADTLVPFLQAEQNYAAANAPKRLVEIAGDHNNFLEAGRTEFVTGFERFLDLLEHPLQTLVLPALRANEPPWVGKQ